VGGKRRIRRLAGDLKCGACQQAEQASVRRND
jgi:hypothetical protein